MCGFIIIIENIFIMRNLTDMLKTVETGVDPHLCVVFLSSSSLVIVVSYQHTQTRKITLVILLFEINVA